MLSLGTVSFPPKPICLIPESSFPAIQIRHKCPISVLAPSIKMTRSSVVMMEKREEELKVIRAKTTEKLTKRLLILKKSTRNEFKSSEFRRMRKMGVFHGSQIARMVKREREIEEGVGNRLSRKLDRRWKRSIVVRPPPSLKKLQEEEAAAEAEKSA
ncbi:50S ribosomal protein L29 [Populus alba x Populus x berolinensis]|uniref:50S ribosomal protein L29 n=1 Tax=Populus alba x Populus x berolinensis TaxID=444605 RepID=A0AAD6QU82_9ROSI|nr:50S ribosomal protein L29 [Populus alba x Populus x berolinensis]